MSLGEIVQSYGKGLYSVKIHRTINQAQAKIDAMTDESHRLTLEIIALNAEAQAILNDPNLSSSQKLLQTADIRRKINAKNILKNQLETAISIFERLIAEEGRIFMAWCGDLTEDASGFVAIADVPGENIRNFNIYPQYPELKFSRDRNYSRTLDGTLKPAALIGVRSNFINAALMPAIRKWKPTYRYGKITSINYSAHVCNVDLYPAYCKYLFDRININISSGLSGVPIEYMQCNSAAFEVGDDVLIRFKDFNWKSPVVIGFKTDPKPCATQEFIVITCTNSLLSPITSLTYCLVWDAWNHRLALNIPDNEGNPITTWPVLKSSISNWIATRERSDAPLGSGGKDLWDTTDQVSWVYPNGDPYSDSIEIENFSVPSTCCGAPSFPTYESTETTGTQAVKVPFGTHLTQIPNSFRSSVLQENSVNSLYESTREIIESNPGTPECTCFPTHQFIVYENQNNVQVKTPVGDWFSYNISETLNGFLCPYSGFFPYPSCSPQIVEKNYIAYRNRDSDFCFKGAKSIVQIYATIYRPFTSRHETEYRDSTHVQTKSFDFSWAGGQEKKIIGACTTHESSIDVNPATLPAEYPDFTMHRDAFTAALVSLFDKYISESTSFITYPTLQVQVAQACCWYDWMDSNWTNTITNIRNQSQIHAFEFDADFYKAYWSEISGS